VTAGVRLAVVSAPVPVEGLVMRFLKAFPIAGLVLMTGLFVGCSQQPPRMKNQSTTLDSGETKVQLPGKKKAFDAAQ
jgi:hypothetical protein